MRTERADRADDPRARFSNLEATRRVVDALRSGRHRAAGGLWGGSAALLLACLAEQRRYVHEEPGADELVVQPVLAEDVANVLAKVTFYALAKFLHAVDVVLGHPPRTVLGVRRAGLELLDPFLYFEVPGNVGDKIP